jgi:hypothetical protein
MKETKTFINTGESVEVKESAETEVSEVVEDKTEDSNLEVVSEETKEKEFSEVEKEQMNLGWDPSGPKSAEEYKKDGEIIQGKKKIKELEAALNAVTSRFDTLEKKTYDKAIKELQIQQQAAREDRDFDRYDQVTKEINDLSSEPEAKVPDNAESLVRSFSERNSSWYNTDSGENIAMMKEAQEIEELLPSDLSLEDKLNKVEEAIKAKYSHRFETVNPNRKAPPMVATQAAPAAPNKIKLNAREVELGKDFISRGIYKDMNEWAEHLTMHKSGRTQVIKA